MSSITKFDKNGNILHHFLLCSCGSEILHIEYDKDIELADFCIYYHYPASLGPKLSVYQRFRYCWQVIMTGKPYDDQLTLDNHGLKDLKNFLHHIEL